MKNWQETTDFLREIPLPTATKSYTPVPHSLFLDEIKEELYKNNHTIKHERYLTDKNGQIMTGSYIIENPDTEINPSIYFTNSYNKMRRAELTSGVMVLVCKNGMIGNLTNTAFKRKHSGTVLEDLRANIISTVANIENEFEKLRKNAEEMKQIQLSEKNVATLIGDMYINEGLLQETQLSTLKRELKHTQNFKGDTLWDLYNNITECLKDNHPLLFDKQHLKLHSYMSDVFSLTGSRGLYKKQDLIENAILV